MALTLIHDKFKTLIDSFTGADSYAVFIPETAELPAYMYTMTGIARDIESNLRNTSISAHLFNVYVAARTFAECHELAEDLLYYLDQYKNAKEGFLLCLVEDGSDGYDPDLECFTKSFAVSVRVMEK